MIEYNKNGIAFEEVSSVNECIHNAMFAGMMIHSLYCEQKIDQDQYVSLLNEIRDIATSMVLRNTLKYSDN
jgi:hypothetical protein